MDKRLIFPLVKEKSSFRRSSPQTVSRFDHHVYRLRERPPIPRSCDRTWGDSRDGTFLLSLTKGQWIEVPVIQRTFSSQEFVGPIWPKLKRKFSTSRYIIHNKQLFNHILYRVVKTVSNEKQQQFKNPGYFSVDYELYYCSLIVFTRCEWYEGYELVYSNDGHSTLYQLNDSSGVIGSGP